MLTSINPNVLDPHHEIVEMPLGPKLKMIPTGHEGEGSWNKQSELQAASDEHNRCPDGLPRRQADRQSQPKQAKTEEVHLSEIIEDEILQAVVESRLSPDEKKAIAKRKALVPWSENAAWQPISRSKCPKGTIVPMRFLLRYKENQPHARVILQGLKHKDVLESKLDTESPTISRVEKYLLVLMARRKRWHIGTMDVKSAFLQSDYIHQEVEIYGEPSADMRRLLAEMLGLKEDRSCK